MKDLKWFLGILLVGSICFASAVIPNGSVTTVKLAAGAVTTAKIATGAVTQTNRASLAIATSSSSGTFTGTATTPTAVTNLSVTITTTGRPVMICLQPDGTASNALLGVSQTGVTGSYNLITTIYFLRGATNIFIHSIEFTGVTGSSSTVGVDVPTGICNVDTGASAGSTTYSVKYASFTSSYVTAMEDIVLTAFEL